MASSARIEELEKKFNENPRRYFAPLANEYRKAGDVQQAIAICRDVCPAAAGAYERSHRFRPGACSRRATTTRRAGSSRRRLASIPRT